MFHLEIQTPGQPASRFELPTGSYTIGRGDACRIRLRHPEVSERHALLSVRPSGIWIEDLESSNGTLVDGTHITGRVPVLPAQAIVLGPYTLRLINTIAGTSTTQSETSISPSL